MTLELHLALGKTLGHLDERRGNCQNSKDMQVAAGVATGLLYVQQGQ